MSARGSGQAGLQASPAIVLCEMRMLADYLQRRFEYHEEMPSEEDTVRVERFAREMRKWREARKT